MSESVFRERLTSRCELAGVRVTDDAIKSLWLYYDLLSRWNQRMSLTSLPLQDYPFETMDRLIVEPLLAETALSHELRGSWVDLGSGGGSPAIPLKIVRPALQLTMTESRGRKAAFLREAIRVLGLTGAGTLEGRFETLASRPAAAFALVTARAVRVDEALISLATHLLASGGRFLRFGPMSNVPGGFARASEDPALGDERFTILART